MKVYSKAECHTDKIEGEISDSRDSEHEEIYFYTAFRNTIFDVMRDLGWKMTDNKSKANIIWIPKREIKRDDELYDHQKLNHYRRAEELTSKPLFSINMREEMEKTQSKFKGKLCRELASRSFVLPEDHLAMVNDFKKNPGLFIIKPDDQRQGRGIFLLKNLKDILSLNKDLFQTMRYYDTVILDMGIPTKYVAQRYIDRPYLIGGRKFDLRCYVLVVSFDPVIVYIHRNGFCRFSNAPYSMHPKDISKMYIHATNVSLQQKSPSYNKQVGCKWSLQSLKSFLGSKHSQSQVQDVFNDIDIMIIRSLLGVKDKIGSDPDCSKCFELYGFDILIDSQLRPWILEVNSNPSMLAETSDDYKMKYSILTDTFNILMDKSGSPRLQVGGVPSRV